MPVIKITPFDGQFPRKGPYQLGDFEAQVADNVKLYSGELRSFQRPLEVMPQPPIVAGAETIFRLENPVDLAGRWLSWATDVDVVLSPISDTVDGRIYYTGDGSPKKTNFALASTGMGPYPAAFLEMGVPAPTAPVTLSQTGGSGTIETRVYIYTFVSSFGAVREESSPSPPASIDAHPVGATVEVMGMAVTAPTGTYNITHKRIYRAIGGNQTLDYRLVAEVPLAQANFTDTLDDADIPGDVLISLDFTPPPPELRGLVRMSGNFLAAFKDNEVWFSEPNFPHAWPAKYVLTTEHRVVGLGVVGNLLIVGTERMPELIYGTEPATLGQEKIPLVEPCASKRSIATDGEVVIYASPNGLVAIGPGARARFTDRLFRRDEFQRFLPSSIYARIYDGTYFGWYNSPELGEAAMLINSRDVPAMSTIKDFTKAAFIDTRTASLFYVRNDGKLYQFDGQPNNAEPLVWRSKKFDMPFPTSMGCFQLYADYDALTQDFDASQAAVEFNQQVLTNNELEGPYTTMTYAMLPLAGTNLITRPESTDPRFAIVRVFGDGQLVREAQFTDERPQKLPSGRKYRTIEIEITSNISVYSVAVASTVGDLKEV